MIEIMNVSLYIYEVFFVFFLMERVVIDKMFGKIGFEDGDVMFCFGGFIFNMYVFNIVRYFKYLEVKKKGIKGIFDICVFIFEKVKIYF